MVHYTYSELIDKVPYKKGDLHGNLKKVLGYLDPDNNFSYSNWEDMKDLTVCHSRCACSKKIHYSHKIRHKKTGDILSVGSRCIGKFSKEIKKDANRRVYRAKNPNRIYCNSCDGSVSKKVCEEFKGMDIFYHKKCLAIKFSVCSHCGLYKKYNCKCKYVKCKSCDKELNHSVLPNWCVRCGYCYFILKNKDSI